MKELPVTQTDTQQIPIRCETTGRLVARADEHGVYFFCRQHNTQHLMSWTALERLREDIRLGEVKPKQMV